MQGLESVSAAEQQVHTAVTNAPGHAVLLHCLQDITWDGEYAGTRHAQQPNRVQTSCAVGPRQLSRAAIYPAYSAPAGM
jgi:hypothetical protein